MNMSAFQKIVQRVSGSEKAEAGDVIEPKANYTKSDEKAALPINQFAAKDEPTRWQRSLGNLTARMMI